MDSKKKKELEDFMNDVLKHEDNLQHDEHEDPLTFVDESDNEN